MKIQFHKASLVLFICTISGPLFGDPDFSSVKQDATEISTFAKRIKAAGQLIDTIPTADHGYVSLSATGGENFLVRKIASSGQRVWERLLKFQVDVTASLQAITQTTDGGYVLAGGSLNCFSFYCYYSNFQEAAILIKLRSNGTVAWKRKFSTNSNRVVFTSLVSRADGGVVVTGTTDQSSLILARYTSTGNLLWSKSFPQDLDLSLIGSPQLIQTSNNSLILVAEFENGVLVIKVNDSGTILWKKSLQMPKLFVQKIVPTSDDGIVLAGTCTNCNQLFLVRLRADGKVRAKLRYSLQVPRVRSITDIIQTSDGGFTITGSIADKAGHNPSLFLAKIDSKGNASFQRTFRIARSRGGSIFAISDGYLIFGVASSQTSQDTIILKLDSQGFLPGCNFVSSVPISRVAFGNLTTSQRQISAPADLSIGTSDFAGRSPISHLPESNICP